MSEKGTPGLVVTIALLRKEFTRAQHQSRTRRVFFLFCGGIFFTYFVMCMHKLFCMVFREVYIL